MNALATIPTADLIAELCTRAAHRRRPDLPAIYSHALEAVGHVLNLTPESITSRSRSSSLTYARYMAFYLMSATGATTAQIHAAYSLTNGTVQNGLIRHAQRMRSSKQWQTYTHQALDYFQNQPTSTTCPTPSPATAAAAPALPNTPATLHSASTTTSAKSA